ncbi:DUF5305 domain-containing protein [Haloplanus sp. C73]|uniref:DUF5305 domain-containing protein n=1 Tax=Haloplanus sp. C73 TaxID=3421641 RepID=UPI003EBE67F8
MSSGGDRTEVRVRAALDQWLWVIVLLAVVLAAVGGFATYTAYQSPGTTTEQREVARWQGNGTYTTSATVTEPNPLFDVDTELTDRPAYFFAASPRLDGTFVFEYQASDGGSVDVTVSQTLVLRSISEEEDSTTEYWRIEEPLDTTTASDVGPGESATATFSRNVSQVQSRIDTIDESLGGMPGSSEIVVRSDIDVEGEINGESVDRSATYRLPIVVDGSTYQPGAVEGESLTGSTTEQITREREYGPLYRLGGPLALLVGLVGAVGLGYGRYDDRFTVSEADRTMLEFESTRAEFDDWITTARLPDDVLDRPRVEVDSLAGLVDTAIDVDARVFEHPEDGVFYVTHEGLLYVFEPPTAGLDAMLGDDEGEVDAAEGDAS